MDHRAVGVIFIVHGAAISQEHNNDYWWQEKADLLLNDGVEQKAQETLPLQSCGYMGTRQGRTWMTTEGSSALRPQVVCMQYS